MKRIFPILAIAVLLAAALIALAITKADIAKDPVCGMEVSTANAEYKIESPHGNIYFCSQNCKDKFLANPAAYTPQMPPESASQPAAQEAKSGCEGCPGQAKAATQSTAVNKAEHACAGNCGKTRVKEINEFHAALKPLEAGEGQAKVALIKTAVAELVTRKDAVMSAQCPDGICPESFGSMRAAFGLKVDALHSAVQNGDDAAIAIAFKEMHSAYEALDVMAR